MKMLNNNLLCEDLSSNVQETSSGFAVKNEERFKKLLVLESSEEDVPVGSTIKVPINSGEETEEYNKTLLVIRRMDIISVL